MIWKLAGILFLSFNSLSQTVERIDASNFRIDSIAFSIDKINYLKEIEQPFIRGGDAKYARKSQLFFRLKNASSISLSIGDSVFTEELLFLKKTLTEYYSFSDNVTEHEGKKVYTYTLNPDKKHTNYQLILSPLYLQGKQYFVLLEVDAKDLKYGFRLIDDLERF